MVNNREYQLVRPDGTVLVGCVAPEYLPPPEGWGLPAGHDLIIGRCYGRWRELPDGPWKIIASYPEGFPGLPMLWDHTGEGHFSPYDNQAVPREVWGRTERQP